MSLYRLKKYASFHFVAILATCAFFTSCNQTDTATTPQPQDDLRLGVETVAGNALNHYNSYGDYVNAGTTESVRTKNYREKEEADSNTVFVIYGIDLKTPQFAKGDFIWIGDLAQTNHPDSGFDGFTLPITGAVIALRKSTIDMLCPDGTRFIIDGKEMDRAAFDKIRPIEIQCVTIKGDTLLIKKRFYPEPDAGNSDVDKAQDDEGHLMRRMFTAEDVARYKASQSK